jgi:arabinose-5-phosphate isomerase
LKNKILKTALKTIQIEGEAISRLVEFIDADFASVVEHIYRSKGRVVVTGIGKSANVATKIVATLNSTGTPAIFMHAADAIHGDLGMIQRDDMVICISKSGNTPEIKVLIPLIKQAGNTLIALTSNKDSYLGNNAHFVLNAHVEKEACPNNLAPTTSTTAQMVMGDALAISLLELRGFSSEDFAKYHPGGALGKRLYLQVDDLIANNEKPEVLDTASIKEVIIEISKKRLGVTAVIDRNKTVLGIITDGDIRRMLSANDDFLKLLAKDIMSKNPKTVQTGTLAINALTIMEENDITQLLVLDNNNEYLGVVHLHDLIKEGII